eukprot:948932-Prymnesium_polylepis.1
MQQQTLMRARRVDAAVCRGAARAAATAAGTAAARVADGRRRLRKRAGFAATALRGHPRPAAA